MKTHHELAKMKLPTILGAFLLIFNGLAQEIPSQIDVVPPSPNAAAINKYIDFPVSYYNGTVDVSIPIFQIKTTNLNLPISLSYHTSGLKVEEIPSFVGAGWTLNAGGVISRTVRGLKDEENANGKKGLFRVDHLYNTNDYLDFSEINNCSVSRDMYDGNPTNTTDSLAMGFLDTEPDIFHYSAPGIAGGKFTFNHDVELHKLTADDVSISDPITSAGDFPATASWTITGPDGTVYTYAKIEKTAVTSICSGDVSQYQSAWYLTKMENDGDYIDFEYEAETLTYDTRLSESKQFKISGIGASVISNDCEIATTVNAVRLSKITSSNGYEITFEESTVADRHDLDGSYQLDRIKVKKGTVNVKTLKFNYGYFGSNHKLKLNSIIPENPSNASETLEGHEFEYFSPTSVPAMTSLSQDWWGYYNGKSNNSLIPEYDDGINHVNIGSTVDRDPVLSHTKRGALKKVTYPTGGYTEFEFELNEYREDNQDKDGAGLRIKNMISYDPASSRYTVKRFQYHLDPSGNSSGRLFTPPILGGHVTEVVEGSMGGGSTCVEGDIAEYVNLSSVTMLPLAVYGGTHVGYSEVRAFDISHANRNSTITTSMKVNGETVFKYVNDVPTISGFPYRPQTDYSYKNGKLEWEETYKLDGSSLVLQRTVENSYTDIIENTGTPALVQGMIYKYEREATCYSCTGNTTSATYTMNRRWYRLDSSETIDHLGNDDLVQTTNYTYGSSAHHFLTKKQWTGSQGETIEELYTRDGTDPALITERELKVASTTTEKQKFTYDGKSLKKLELYDVDASTYFTKNEYTYNSDNAITEAKEYTGASDELINAYIWSYDNTYPVVHCQDITNATLVSKVAAAINAISAYSGGINDLDNVLANTSHWNEFNTNLRTQLSNKIFTTYRFKDGVGMISSTDANGISQYYEYDDFNRLIRLKDTNSKILQEMEYNYSNN